MKRINLSEVDVKEAKKFFSHYKAGKTFYYTRFFKGESQYIKIFIMRGNAPCRVTRYAAAISGYSLVEIDGFSYLKFDGCGVDGGVSVVTAISRAVKKDGKAFSAVEL